MRLFYFYLFIISTLFFSSQAVFAISTTSVPSDCVINITLRVFSKGAEVQCLQKKIGVAIDGSFGPLTKVAVLVFQSKNGLVADGIVGPLTRAMLNTVKVSGNFPEGCISNVGYSPTTGIKCDSTVKSVVNKDLNSTPTPTPTPILTPITNPNLSNLDKFITRIVDVNRKNGKSEEDLQLIASTLRKKIENSNIDYNKKFWEMLVNESKLSANLNTKPLASFFDKVFSKTFSFLGITPSVARASVGIQFGGALLASYDECLNFEIVLFIEPLPPTFVAMLSYIPFTQGFASYNIPETNWLLGLYSGIGLCVLDYYPYVAFNTEGLIMPMVGSSPL